MDSKLKTRPLFEPAIVRRAAADALRKLVDDFKAIVALRSRYLPTQPFEVLEEKPKKPEKRELEMARQLISSLATDFEPSKYRDEYREELTNLLEQKAAGKEIVSAPSEEPKPTKAPDLMAALEESLAAVRGERVPAEPSLEQQRQCMLHHYRLVIERFGEEKGTMLMRKYACCYAQGKHGARHFRTAVAHAASPEQFYRAVDEHFPRDAV